MKSRYIAVLVLLGIVAFSGVCHAGALFGGERTVDIAMTGFCDGYHLVINMNTGIVTGNQTGCDSQAVFGTVSSLIGFNQKGAAVTVRDLVFNTYKVIRDSGTWTYYNSNGTVANSGTYTRGTPASPQPQSTTSSNQ
jgi:hypothetical protein